MNNKGQVNGIGIFNAFWLFPLLIIMYYIFLLIFNPMLAILDFSNTPNGNLVQLVLYLWPVVVAVVWTMSAIQKMRE